MIALLIVTLTLLMLGLAAFALYTVRVVKQIESLLPPVGKFIMVFGHEIHVFEKGQGTPIVLIHGLSGQVHHFNYGIADRLALTHRVIMVDRPGSGYSQRTLGRLPSVEAQADILAELLRVIGLHQPIVVGHSLGGAIGLALAIRHPSCVSGLALIAPLSHAPQVISPAFNALLIPQSIRKLFAYTLYLALMKLRREQILSAVFAPEAAPDDFAIRGGGLLSMRPNHFIAACEDLAGAAQSVSSLCQQYSRLNLPVAVLFGKGDQILSAHDQGTALVEKIPGSQLTLIDGGHMLPITQADLTADFIGHFAATVLPKQVA